MVITHIQQLKLLYQINMKDLVTIVIPCKNEERYIYNTLARISNQMNSEGVRIIIADANSTDNTLSEISRAKKELKLKIKVIEGGPVSFARNAGAKLVKTPYVVFIDADTTLLDSTILMLSLFSCKEMGGKLATCRTKSTSNDIRSKLLFKVFCFIQKHLLKEPFSTGAYFFTEVKEFKKLGGFDEQVLQSEDYLLSKKYKKSEFTILNLHIGQDDRRFKQIGYLGFLKLILHNFINRNNPDYFKQPTNYWL